MRHRAQLTNSGGFCGLKALLVPAAALLLTVTAGCTGAQGPSTHTTAPRSTESGSAASSNKAGGPVAPTNSTKPDAVPGALGRLAVSTRGDSAFGDPVVQRWFAAYERLYLPDEFTTNATGHADLTTITTSARALFTAECWQRLAAQINPNVEGGNASLFNTMQGWVINQTAPNERAYRLKFSLDGTVVQAAQMQVRVTLVLHTGGGANTRVEYPLILSFTRGSVPGIPSITSLWLVSSITQLPSDVLTGSPTR